MNNRITGLLATAIVSGLIAGSVAHAEEEGGDKGAAPSAKEAKPPMKHKKHHDSNSCKGKKDGCGSKSKSAEKSDAPAAEPTTPPSGN